MKLLSRLGSLFRNLTRKRAVEQELAEELRTFVEMLTRAKMCEGHGESEARRLALLELGGVEQVKEQVREVRLGRFLETRWQDLRFAGRTVRKSPVFSLTVMLVLALGLGSTALIFSLVNAVLLQGPPFPQAGQLFLLWQDLPQEKRVSFSTREFQVWQKETQVFEGLASYSGNGFVVSGRGDPELALGRQVAPGFFPLLRTPPALGRAFLPSESEVGQDHVVILSHALWRDKFGLREDALGQSVIMNGEPFTVVGVMPESFAFPDRETRLWVPAALDGPFFQQHPDAHFHRVVGRLKIGVTAQRLQAEVDVLGTRMNAPGDDTVRRFFAVPLQEVFAADLRRPLLVLLAAVVFLLLIACANVANLLLARAQTRQGEMAVRRALGASHGRLVAQMLTESALLAVLGGALGVAVAGGGLYFLKLFAAANLPELLHARLDASSLAFVFLLTVATGVLFGFAPAIAASHPTLLPTMKGAAHSSSGAASERTRRALVFLEISLACLLLIGCTLMLRSYDALAHADPGFRAQNVVTASAVLMKQSYPESAGLIRFYRESLAAVRALPGVSAAGLVTHLPFGGNDWGTSYEVEGRPALAGVQFNAQVRPVSPGYFSTLAIPLPHGRDFSEQDHESAPGVAIVNRLLADRFWPGENPVGKRIRYDRDWLEIVGVCGNIKHSRLEAEPDAQIYVPYPQVPAGVIQFVGRELNFVVHADRPAAVGAELRGALKQLDAGLVLQVNTLETLIHDSIAQSRFRTWLIAIVSSFALLLACLGIYGVIAYLVTQRQREIGIRLALGAPRRDILRLVLSRTLRLAATGVFGGSIAAFFFAQFLRSILFGIDAHDPITFCAVPAGLIAVALLAGYLPARRATRVDPMSSLRCE